MASPSSLPTGLKEIEPIGYIGIDFGTSNSHFAYCNVDGNLVAESIRLGGKASQCTCVLWKEPGQREEDIVAYGVQALEEWSNRGPSERQHHRFAAGFKPDIVSSERARRDAWAFLARAFAGIKASGVVRTIGVTAGMPVVIGVPAEVSDEQKRITAEVAEQAGFGRVTCVAEPLGALAFHLAKKDITAAEARAGVVVVDFGGGTLDVALVDAKGLREPWGEPLLGGRFFDDLFYQWLLDQNPGLAIDPLDVLYVWQVTCRELKEDFSRRWAERGPTDDFQKRVPIGERYWRFKAASVAEFKQRAENYKPSPLAQAYFRDVGGSLAHLADGRVDLIGWVRRTLAPRDGVQLPRQFARVVLTGGSSEWPFVKDLASEVYGVPRENIICSATPEITIGSGLAIYHVLRRRYEKTCLFLRAEKPDRIAAFQAAVALRLRTFSADVTQTAIDSLMARVEAIFLEWRNNGGSLEDVENQVDTLCKSFEPEVETLVKEKARYLAKDLVRLLRDHLKQWLAEHDIQREVDQFVPADLGIDAAEAMKGKEAAGGIAKDLTLRVTAALAGVVVIVTAAIKAKVVVALFLAHPIAGLTALLASVLGFKVVNEFVEKKIKTYRWGRVPFQGDLKAMRLVLSEERLKQKLEDSRKEAIATLSVEIEKNLEGFRDQVRVAFEQVIEEVIQDLGVLEQIRTAGK
jgi:cell division ATPase FtsA